MTTLPDYFARGCLISVNYVFSKDGRFDNGAQLSGIHRRIFDFETDTRNTKSNWLRRELLDEREKTDNLDSILCSASRSFLHFSYFRCTNGPPFVFIMEKGKTNGFCLNIKAGTREPALKKSEPENK